jgi:hypothetical protein
VPAVPYKELRGQASAESSAGIRASSGPAPSRKPVAATTPACRPPPSAKSAPSTTPASAHWKWPSAAWAFPRGRTTAS